jgi:hypothetical protein
MTPFAQLGVMNKRAAVQAPPPQYELPVNAQSGLRDPHAANYSPVPGTQAALQAQPRWGEVQNGLGDFALSAIPFVGSAYMGNKAIQDFRRGNVWSGVGNGLMAGLSLIPGVGFAKGVLGAGAKGIMAGVRAGKAGMFAASGGLSPGKTLAAGLGAEALTMVPGANTPPVNPNAYRTPTTPAGGLQRAMTSAVVNNGRPPAALPTP